MINTYAFVFARGGSVGLPAKNIKPLGGIPLLGHSIKLAQTLPSVKKIFVSTDCAEIARVAETYGANVIQRPDILANSTASEWLAWQHAITHLEKEGDYFDVFLSLPTTSPLRHKQDVQNCLEILDGETDVVLTVTPSYRNPFFNMIVRKENGESQLLNNQGIIRRQDAPETYDITTVAYVSRPQFIMQNTGIFTGRVKSVLIPKERAIDIDDEWDFLMAETIYNRMKS